MSDLVAPRPSTGTLTIRTVRGVVGERSDVGLAPWMRLFPLTSRQERCTNGPIRLQVRRETRPRHTPERGKNSRAAGAGYTADPTLLQFRFLFCAFGIIPVPLRNLFPPFAYNTAYPHDLCSGERTARSRVGWNNRLDWRPRISGKDHRLNHFFLQSIPVARDRFGFGIADALLIEVGMALTIGSVSRST